MYKTMDKAGGMFLWQHKPVLHEGEWIGQEPFEFIGEGLSPNSETQPTIEKVRVITDPITKRKSYEPISSEK